MRKHDMVSGFQSVVDAFLARRMDTQHVSCDGSHPGLVMGHDDLHAIAQPFRDHPRIFSKVGSRVPVFPPSAVILKRLRQVVVEQAGDRVNAPRETTLHEAVVEIQTGVFTAPRPVGRMRVQAMEKR